MRGNRGRDTRPELAVRRELHRRGLRYRIGYRPLPELRRTVDIAFSRPKIAVFIDGCYWHGCEQHYRPARTNTDYWSPKIAANRARDTDTDARLLAAGWTVLRYWEHEAPKVVADEVEAAVRGTAEPPATWFTLDALEADAAGMGAPMPSWPAVRFGESWNGWATPVVTRDVLASILDVVRATTGEQHRWDGDVAIIAGPVDEPRRAPEHEDRLEPGDSRLYDLGTLGWTWVMLRDG